MDSLRCVQEKVIYTSFSKKKPSDEAGESKSVRKGEVRNRQRSLVLGGFTSQSGLVRTRVRKIWKEKPHILLLVQFSFLS